MTDIVKRLRALDAWALDDATAVMHAGADEIERLRQALQHVTLWVEKYANPQAILPYNTKAARVALGETGHE